MKNHTEFRTFIRYFIPSMLGMALLAIYTFVDTFVVGRKYGAVALGAMGICTPVITTAYAFGYLFGLGGSSLYSICKGRKDDRKASEYFSTSFLSALALGFTIMVLLNIFLYPVAYFLGADPENIGYVIPYLRCVAVYFPGFMLDVLMLCYMKNSGHPNVAMAATVIGTGGNVVLDFLFVFGFDWGMFGAAFATCLCSFLSFCIDFCYAYWKKTDIRVHVRHFCRALCPRIMANGAGSFVLEASSGIVTFVFIGRATALYGIIGASVYTIIMNWSLIAVNLMQGVGQAAQPLISHSYGEGNRSALQVYTRLGYCFSIAFGLTYLLIGFLFPDQLVSVFANDSSELIQLARGSFSLYMPAYCIMSIGIMTGIFFQAIGKAVRSFLIMAARGIILPSVLAYVMSALWGRSGLWLAMPAAEGITSIAACILLLRYNISSHTEKKYCL